MNRRYLYIAFVAALLAGCSKKDSPAEVNAAKPTEPPVVKVIIAETRKVEKSISVTGSLMPEETVTVSAEVGGRIAAIHYDFGQFVKQGAVIAEIDKQEYQIAYDRAKAALAQALARIGLDPSQDKVTPESTPAIRQARAQAEDAKSKFDRAAKLVQSGDISQDRYIELEKAYLARKAALEATQDDLRTQLASVQALQAEVRLAQKRLGDTVVRAPFDGSISARNAGPGQYIKDNTPIVTIVKTHPLRLRADIPESAIGTVRAGTQLVFTTDAAPGAEFHAVVRELNPGLDARARSLTAEARIVENDPRLKPGMFVQVRLVTSKDFQIVAVPKSALYTVAGLTKIFVIRDGKVLECKVPPGMDVDGWTEVPPDVVRPGDQIAVSSLQNLVTGLQVRPQPAPATKG
jgi:RND family efflux transporter MFP subunit